MKVSATVSEEAYKVFFFSFLQFLFSSVSFFNFFSILFSTQALVGLSVALSKARDIGNDEVARIG